MKHVAPPKVFHRLLSKMFDNTPMEELEGDLLDDFQRNVKKYGLNRARIYFMLDVLRLIRLIPRSRRNAQKSKTMNSLFLFNLKYSLRSIKKHALYQGLNVVSLTLGFTCFALIYLFVFNHYQKDNFLEDRDRIVRLNVISDRGEGTGVHTGIPLVLKKDFPEIEAATRLNAYEMEITLPGNEETFTEQVCHTQADFMEIFQIKTLMGQRFPEDKTGVLLSESMALKLFSSVEKAIGSPLTLKIFDRESDKFVVGIVEDQPINSSFKAQIITMDGFAENTLLESNAYTAVAGFFKVSKGADLVAISNKLPTHLKNYTKNNSVLNFKYVFRNMDEMKVNPSYTSGFIQSIDGQTLTIFKLVGFVVLLLAIANYLNLNTAVTLKRTQEVGIRHAIGASKANLFNQLLSESLIIGAASIILSGLLTVSLLNRVESYTGLTMTVDPHLTPWIPVIGILLLLSLVLISSIYPAFIFSRVRFEKLLKSSATKSPKSKWLRSSLLALQFAISTFLIIGSLTFLKQLEFINDTHKVGEIGDVVILKGKIGVQRAAIEQQLKQLPEVGMLSFSSIIPGPSDNRKFGIGTRDFDQTLDFYAIDKSYVEVMGLEIVEGRNINTDLGDQFDILMNEAAVAVAKKDTVINAKFNFMSKEPNTVVGIIANFPVGTIKAEIRPSVYVQADQGDNFQNMVDKVAIKLKQDNALEAMNKIEAVWLEVFPEQPFDAEFMDDRIAKIYTDELKMGQLFGIFTAIAIVISCLGLIGLLTYLVQIKMKEIGIRKVLGANFMILARLLTLNIWKVLVVASVISFPLSYYFLEDWLTSFVYRTNVSSELFVMTIVFFVLIVSVTVFWQIRNAVRVNPTEILRDE